MTLQNSTDRDLLIRVDADTKNTGLRVKELAERTSVLSDRSSELSAKMLELTMNVGALVKSMEKAENGLQTLAEMRQIDQHNSDRIDALERAVKNSENTAVEFRSDATNRLQGIEQKFDRGFFLAKIVTGIIGSPVLVVACIQILQFVQRHN